MPASAPEPDTGAVNAAVVYYSLTGNVRALAEAAAEGAAKAGAEVRLLSVGEATNDDLVWADAVLFGTPTRYGSMAAQLKEFIDETGPLWKAGRLAGRVYGAFVSTASAHGGQESTLLSLMTVFCHWGGIIVPPGFTAPIQFASGNPYGTSHVSAKGSRPGDVELDAARYQARRVVEVAAALKAGGAGAAG
ncbi:NAD(P)H-dependent oxidoreductase [Actinospica durhamensis]|uniref:NAD(P)H-dependent oxidoreductase n=1 Tax=Actinospica durhamensis TaxID=1508375 RepID=A0A941EQH5_9ACTN|nr:NAD(P)H-dependent oxidoreductase [Actinospica durhamensis]MBR7831904.1 NAD(P)H-dependent oxidoreductase [Actinospica durhamensis]